MWWFVLSQGGAGKLEVGVFGIVLRCVAGIQNPKSNTWTLMKCVQIMFNIK